MAKLQFNYIGLLRFKFEIFDTLIHLDHTNFEYGITKFHKVFQIQ